MKTSWRLFLLTLALVTWSGCNLGSRPPEQLFDLRAGQPVSFDSVLPQLSRQQFILVGEQHTDAGHHLIQLQVIRGLHKAGVPLAIGLEMIQSASQADLDRWVAGRIPLAGMEKVFSRNWNYPFALYQPVFELARREKIPLVGLNVSPAVTRKVAREGFTSLSPKEREQIPNVTCDVDPDYMDYIRQAHGAHAHAGMGFQNFCEAQMVWDTAMAVRAVQYGKSHPGRLMVLLAGIGHVRNNAIPRQIRKQGNFSVTVILPAVPGEIEPGRLNADDGDYIFLAVGR